MVKIHLVFDPARKNIENYFKKSIELICLDSTYRPFGLLAQLVERFAEIVGSNPVRAWIFFRP